MVINGIVVMMGVSQRRERERQTRRDAILSAAEGLFLSKGYDSTTMDDLAKKVELGKGTLYLYFKDKDELYAAIVVRGTAILNNMFKSAMGRSRNGMEKTYAMGLAFYEFYRLHTEYCTTFLLSDLKINRKENRYAADLARLGMENMGLMVSALKEGMADGSIRNDIDVMKTAVSLAFSVQGVVTQIATGALGSSGLGGDEKDYVVYTMDLLRRAIEPRRR